MACLFIVIPEMGAHALGHGVIALLGPSAGLQLAQNAQLLACILGVIAVVGLFAVVCTLAFRKPGQGWSRSSQDVCADPAAQTCANPAPDVAPEERREDPESLLTQTVSHLAAEYGLTPRETDMVGFICRGYTNKRISQLCCVSVNTVQTHIQNCYRKLGVHNRQELIDLLEGQQEGR